MRKLGLVLALVFVVGLSGNAFAQDKPNPSGSDQELSITSRFGLIETEYYSLKNGLSPAFSLGFGSKEGSLMLGFNTGRDLFTFSYGLEKTFFNGNVLTGFGGVYGKAYNYHGTGQTYSFGTPYGMLGLNFFKGFYMSTKIGLGQEYQDFSFGIQLKEIF